MEAIDSPAELSARDGGDGIAVRGVRFSYGNRRGKGREGARRKNAEIEVLDDFDVSCRHGEVLSVVGPSGCGKSTLLALLAGFVDPVQGTIEVAGASGPAERLGACAHMPQRDTLLPWFSALDNAALALRNQGEGRRESRRRAAESFARFKLGGFESASPGELSGGMRQRVAFVRTLLAGKPVLLLDEPFGALDAITRAEMQAWLAEALRGEPRTTVLITHDVEEALYLGDRVAILSARPARVIEELTSPRPPRTTGAEWSNRAATLADPSFIAARRHAMALLGGPR